MARPPTGQIIERHGKGGTMFAVRFHAYGKRRYLTLGSPEEGWTRELAETELANVLADVRRGLWRDEADVGDKGGPVTRPVPTFGEFASGWLEDRKADGLRERTVEHHEWTTGHLLDWFGRMRLDEIDIEAVDHFKRGKLSEGVLGPNSVNRMIAQLALIFEYAIEAGHVGSNPAAGRRRRVKGMTPRRTFFWPEQLPALLRAAKGRYSGRGRALVGVLAVAGLRIGEALALEWRDVNLARSELVVRRSKTEAGERIVVLPRALTEELAEWKARARLPSPGDYVFGTSQGKQDSRSNVTRRLLRPVVEKANAELAKVGISTIEALTLHGLRRGAAILSEATGATASETAGQLGHKNPTITTGIYMVAMKHRARLSQAERTAFAEAVEWASMGTSGQTEGPSLEVVPEASAAEAA
jgi:integrase